MPGVQSDQFERSLLQEEIKVRRVIDPAQIIPGRPVDFQLGNQNATDRRTYRALQDLIETKVEGSSNLGSANVGELLVFTATGWEGQNKRTYLSLDDLTDVSVSAPTTNHILKHNGSVFTNVSIIDLLTLDQLAGVVAPTPASGNILRHNGTNWVNVALAELIPLTDLSDVAISAPSTNQVLKYNGSAWVNGSFSGVLALDDLTDVVIAGPATAQTLRYNGTNFVNAALSADDLSNESTLVRTTMPEGRNIAFGTTTGSQLGTVGGASGQKIGAFGATPIVQPLLATGAGATVDNVITALQALGWVRQT